MNDSTTTITSLQSELKNAEAGIAKMEAQIDSAAAAAKPDPDEALIRQKMTKGQMTREQAIGVIERQREQDRNPPPRLARPQK